MKFHKIECDGKFILELPSPFPSWDAADEGRLAYSTSVAKMFLAGNSSWESVWTAGNQGTGSGLDADLLDGYDSGNASGEIPISNTIICVDLNADLLDGQEGSFYRNASNLNAGTVPAARLSGTYNIDISGTAGSATYS